MLGSENYAGLSSLRSELQAAERSRLDHYEGKGEREREREAERESGAYRAFERSARRERLRPRRRARI